MDKELELEALNEAPFSKDSPARSYFARGYIKGATTSSRVKKLENRVKELEDLLNDFPGFNVMGIQPEKIISWISRLDELLTNKSK